MLSAQAKKEFIEVAGSRGYLDRPEDLMLYEYDASVGAICVRGTTPSCT